MENPIIDAIGKKQRFSQFGALWTDEEIRLLNSIQERTKHRAQVAAEYQAQAKELGYRHRSGQAIYSRLQQCYPDCRSRFAWSEDEDNHLIELLQEYPFAMASEKYCHWAMTRGYPKRSNVSLHCRSERLGVSNIDPVVVASIGSIARSLGIPRQTIAKLLRKSGIKTQAVGQQVTCNVDDFYSWFVRSGAWIVTLNGIAQTNSSKPELDNWAMLLNLPINGVKAQWKIAESRITKVRSPLGFEALRINEFARQNRISSNAIRMAIRKGRSEVAGVRFEVCS